MAIANNVTLTTVEGTFVDFRGQPIAGQVKFTLDAVLRNAIADQIIIPSTITVTLDATGSFSVQLPVTDDPDIAPQGFKYSLEESFAGGRTYDIGFSLNDVTAVPATYGLVASTFPSYTAVMANRASYNHLKVGTIMTLPVFNIADYAPIPTFTAYLSFASASAWVDLQNRANTADGYVNQANGRVNGLTATQFNTYATQAQGHATAALASQATAEAQLALIETETASRLNGFMMVGA